MVDSPRRGAHFGPSAGSGADRREHVVQLPQMPDMDATAEDAAPADATRMMPSRQGVAASTNASSPVPATDRTQVMPHAAVSDARGASADLQGGEPFASQTSNSFHVDRYEDEGMSTGKKVAIGVAIVAFIAILAGVGFALVNGTIALPGLPEPAVEQGSGDSTKKDADDSADSAIGAPTVEDDSGGQDDSGTMTVAPGGEGADNTVDASTLFGDGNGGTGSKGNSNSGNNASGSNGGSNGSSSNGDSNNGGSSNGGNNGGSSNSKDPADNDVVMPDDGNGGNAGDNGGSNGGNSGDQGGSGNGNGGVVTEPDGSKWTGYY